MDNIKIIYGCTCCGSELYEEEVIKENGRCRFCDCDDLEIIG